MSKRKAGGSHRADTSHFNELWENELLFIANPSGKPMCIVCETTKKGKVIALSKQTITRRIGKLSRDVSEQLKDRSHTCSLFFISLGKNLQI